MHIRFKFGKGLNFAALGLSKDQAWGLEVPQDCTIEDLKTVFLQLCDEELRYDQLRIRKEDSLEELTEYIGAERACTSTFRPQPCTLLSHGINSDTILEVDIILSEDENEVVQKGLTQIGRGCELHACQEDDRGVSGGTGGGGDDDDDNALLGLGPPLKRRKDDVAQRDVVNAMGREGGQGVGLGTVAPPQQVPDTVVLLDSESDSDVVIMETPYSTPRAMAADAPLHQLHHDHPEQQQQQVGSMPRPPTAQQMQEQQQQATADQPIVAQRPQEGTLGRGQPEGARQEQQREQQQPVTEQQRQQAHASESEQAQGARGQVVGRQHSQFLQRQQRLQEQHEPELHQQPLSAPQQPRTAGRLAQLRQTAQQQQPSTQRPPTSPALGKRQRERPQQEPQRATQPWAQGEHQPQAPRQRAEVSDGQEPQLQQQSALRQVDDRHAQTQTADLGQYQGPQRQSPSQAQQQQADGGQPQKAKQHPQQAQPSERERPQRQQQQVPEMQRPLATQRQTQRAPARQPLPLMPLRQQEQAPAGPQIPGVQRQVGHGTQGQGAQQQQHRAAEWRPREGVPRAVVWSDDEEEPSDNHARVHRKLPGAGVRAAWTIAETQTLADAIETYGKRWSVIEEKTGLRDQKTLRYKWRNLVSMAKAGWIGMRGARLPQSLCDQITNLYQRLGT